MFLIRAGLLALVVGTVVSPINRAAQPVRTLTCTNLASGASWRVTIDFGNSTVDSDPARISSAEISWHGKDGGNYRLDRKSGKLTVAFASSTGGYFIYDRCTL
jgi:hypothetical protein